MLATGVVRSDESNKTEQLTGEILGFLNNLESSEPTTRLNGMRGLMKASMRIRNGWMPRGSLETCAPNNDLLPEVSSEIQQRVEDNLLKHLQALNPLEYKQAVFTEVHHTLSALVGWGSKNSADYLITLLDKVLFTNNAELLSSTLLTAGSIGGPELITSCALVALITKDEHLFNSALNKIVDIATGGSEDLTMPESLDDNKRDQIIRIIDWQKCEELAKGHGCSLNIKTFLITLSKK